MTSLPLLHRQTSEAEPDDIPAGEFLETRTGEDTSGSLTSLSHYTLGVVVWVGWIAWALYMWFFTVSPLRDFVIAGVIWAVTFVITIMGVPAMRRTARNRIRQ